MLIDWFTVSAQVINFLILVALLKHFLYGRILRAMEDRERMIEEQFVEAKTKAQEAEETTDAYRQKIQGLESQRLDIQNKAKSEADALRKDYLEQARDEVNAIRVKWLESLEQEKMSFIQDLRRRTAKHVFTITRRALKDLGHVSLEDHMGQVFLQQLETLDQEKWHDISESLRNGMNHDIVIHSTFPLPEHVQQRLIQIVHDHLLQHPPVTFTVSPEMMGGIELTVPGYRLGWNFAHYLDSLETEFARVLEGEPTPHA